MAKNTTFTPASIDAIGKGALRYSRTPGLAIEVLPSGKKVWKYERRLARDGALIRLSFGLFPAHMMVDARAWAAALNEQVEVGIDPRDAKRAEAAAEKVRKARASMTVAKAHELYVIAAHERRSSRAKKPRTIKKAEPAGAKGSSERWSKNLAISSAACCFGSLLLHGFWKL